MPAPIVAEILGAGGLGVAVVAGVTLGRFLHRKPRYICSCSHGFGMHHQGGKCNGEVERSVYTRQGCRVSVTPCRCLRYDGPEAPPAMWVNQYGGLA